MTLSKRARLALLSLRNYTHEANNVLQAAKAARGGGPLSQVLLGISVVDALSDFVFPQYNVLVDFGFTRFLGGSATSQLAFDVLSASTLPRREVRVTRSTMMNLRVLWFDTPEGAVAFPLGEGGSPYDIFTESGIDCVSSLLWSKYPRGASLRVRMDGAQNIFRNGGGSGTHYALAPVEVSEHYLTLPGEPSAEELASLDDKSLLIVGPSGSGKSTLARKVSLQRQDGGRTLHVTGHAMRKSSVDDIVDLCRLTRPSTLILDDVPLSKARDLGLFVLYEDLRESVGQIITTFMQDESMKNGDTGSLYWPGMRPGRIDKIVVLDYPTAEKREAVLRYYWRLRGLPGVPPTCLVDETDGLTPAYLAKLVENLAKRALSEKALEAELREIRLQSPRRYI